MFEVWEPFCCPWCKVFLVSIKGDVGEQPEPRRDDRCLGTHLCATWLWPLLGSKYVSQLVMVGSPNGITWDNPVGGSSTWLTEFATGWGGWKMQQPGGSGAAKVWGCYSAPFARPSQITQDLLKNPCDLRFVPRIHVFFPAVPTFFSAQRTMLMKSVNRAKTEKPNGQSSGGNIPRATV